MIRRFRFASLLAGPVLHLLMAACEPSGSIAPPIDDGDDDDDPVVVVPGACGSFAAPAAATVPGSTAAPDIQLNPTVRYQTIVGWEAHAQSGEDDFADFGTYADSLLHRAGCDLGISRVRIVVRSGMENPVDHYRRWRNGEITNEQWRCLRWIAVNDNDDPNVLDPAGMNWSEFDRRMDRVVMPLRRTLASRGEQLYINLTYTAFIRQCPGIADLHANLDEYAELILATFRHMQQRWGVVPDGVNIVLEPEHTAWDGTRIGRAMVRTAAVLAAAGFTPEFIGPSTTSMVNALTFFDDMLAVPGVRGLLSEFAFHRYQGAITANLQQIAQRGAQHGVRTAMLERTSADYRALHDDLKIGNVSAWQQFAIAFGHDGSDGSTYFGIDKSDPANPRIIYPTRTRYLRQYFKFVRPGATRIEATSSRPSLDAIGFINANGGHVVVVKATASGPFAIGGLPPGRYGIKYTTANAFDVDRPDVDLGPGQSLPAAIPAAGVLTVYAR